MASHTTLTYWPNPQSSQQNRVSARFANPHTTSRGLVLSGNEPVSGQACNENLASSTSMVSSTIPSFIHQNSPYANISLPPISSRPVTLHPLLRYEPMPCIEYSMVLSPSSATPSRPHLTHPRWLQEPATYPNIGSLTIRATWQERAIVVFAGEAAYGFVTIWDVLVAVYRALRAKATYIHANAHQNPNGLALFHQPVQQGVLKPGEGIIRASTMSLLQGHTAWRGLSPSTVEADVWLLHIR